jgi:preprotein translocase subunit SecA
MPRWSANLAALWRNARPLLRPGAPREPDWRRYSPLVEQIRRRQADFLDQDEPSLNRHGRDLRNRGQSVERMIDAMALACVAARRTLSIKPFDVQIVGALVMHDQKIGEMQTGEAKLSRRCSPYVRTLWMERVSMCGPRTTISLGAMLNGWAQSIGHLVYLSDL